MKRMITFAVSVSVVLAVFAGSVQAQGGRKKEVQKVRLTVVENRYVVTPSRVSKGVPVRMDVDVQTVKGCAGTVVISAFGVKKSVSKDDAMIEFTPDKTGTVEIACSMNMVKGSLTVVTQ